MLFEDTFQMFMLAVLVKKEVPLKALFYKDFICGYIVVVKIVFGTE